MLVCGCSPQIGSTSGGPMPGPPPRIVDPRDPDGPGPGYPDASVPGGDATCERITVDAHAEAVNVMIVLDRSGSMYDFGYPDSEGVDRWTPSVRAIESVTSALE